MDWEKRECMAFVRVCEKKHSFVNNIRICQQQLAASTYLFLDHSKHTLNKKWSSEWIAGYILGPIIKYSFVRALINISQVVFIMQAIVFPTPTYFQLWLIGSFCSDCIVIKDWRLVTWESILFIQRHGPSHEQVAIMFLWEQHF